MFMDGCARKHSVETLLRVRPGTFVAALPYIAPGAKAGLSVKIYGDEGLLEDIELKTEIDSPVFLELDKWNGRFLKLKFEAVNARWREIHVEDRGLNELRHEVPVKKPESNPNVVVYLVDALRADALGCYNRGMATSRFIDSFSNNSVLFKRAYSPSSWTRPGVASVFTGTYAPYHSAVDRDGFLDETIPTLAEILKQKGYHTAAFITNGNIGETFGFARGFDTFRFLPEDPSGLGVYKSSDELLDKTRDEIYKLEEPFFLYIHQSDPHAPYTPPDDIKRRFVPPGSEHISGTMDIFKKLVYRATTPSPGQIEYLRGLYNAEVAGADSGFARFHEILEKRGIAENTIVVFTADHGEEFHEHAGFGHGGTLYEEQVRVPLIVKYPESTRGHIVHEPVSIAEIPVAVLDYLGIAPSFSMNGHNPAKFIDARLDTPLRALYFHEKLDKVEKEAVIDWPMKLIRHINKTNQWGDSVLEWEMYDLESDPLERKPITRGKKITRKILEMELATLRKDNERKKPPIKVQLTPEQKKRMESLGY